MAKLKNKMNTLDKYRSLTEHEIQILISNTCNSDSWETIYVSNDFDPSRCKNTVFSGDVYIGSQKGYCVQDCGLKLPTGISNARIHNCQIGDEVLINNVHSYIANYRIGSHTRIENVDTIAVIQSSSFGNGTTVSVLNETGGREVLITDLLTAQSAYMMAMYRHDALLTKRLKEISQAYADSVESNVGSIGEHVTITGTNVIEDVKIGDAAVIRGATYLKNGSINSNHEAPVKAGFNVVCRDFIMSSGSSVLDGSTVSHCFLGQGTHLSHLFSAHDSLFFANCRGENGEACAVFAGPYTVTMHKSSLLIAGLFSFLNAGSGSNQSNHLYKLGPIHQGVVERGSKTTSDSYILWPSKVGPFTLVMGRHVHNIDSSAFPFSYLIEENNETLLVPGVNLRSVGTIRDAKKWPSRDMRTDPNKLDNINFNLLSPFTVGKMLSGTKKLRKLKDLLGSEGKTYVYHDMKIRSGALEKGLKYYRMGINKFIGNSIIKQLENCPCNSDEEVIEALKPKHHDGDGKWVDVCGMIAPLKQIELLIEDLKSAKINDLHAYNERMQQIHNRYYDLEWCWAYNTLLDWYKLKPEDLNRSMVAKIIEEWMDSVITLDKLLYDDAKKEFELHSRVGFGIDLPGQRKNEDFEMVRGDFENNPFVMDVLDHINKKRALGMDMLKRLEQA